MLSNSAALDSPIHSLAKASKTFCSKCAKPAAHGPHPTWARQRLSQRPDPPQTNEPHRQKQTPQQRSWPHRKAANKALATSCSARSDQRQQQIQHPALRASKSGLMHPTPAVRSKLAEKIGHSHVQSLPQLDQNQTGRRDLTNFKNMNLGGREVYTFGHFVHQQTSDHSRRLKLFVNHL